MFEPSTPIKMKERRQAQLERRMVLALAVIVGYVIYHAVSSGPHVPPPGGRASSTRAPAPPPAVAAQLAAAPAPPPRRRELVIKLAVKSEPCWVEFTARTART